MYRILLGDVGSGENLFARTLRIALLICSAILLLSTTATADSAFAQGLASSGNEQIRTASIATAGVTPIVRRINKIKTLGTCEMRLLPVATVLLAEQSLWNRFRYRVWGIVLFLQVQTAVIIFLLAARRRSRVARNLLERRVAIEAIISRCSQRLSACLASEVDSEIEAGLNLLLESEELDRVSWFVMDEAMTTSKHIFSAHQTSAVSKPAFYGSSELPWITARLQGDRAVFLDRIDALPPEAHTDRMYLENKGTRSIAFIPWNPPKARSILVLACLTEQREWPQLLTNRLPILASVFSNALARKYAEEAEQESEERFRYLVHEAPVGIVLENLEGEILFANPAICRMLGYAAQEIVGAHCWQFSDPDAQADHWDPLQQLRVGTAESCQMEKQYRRKDGTYMWGRVSLTLIGRNGDRDPVILGTMEDVTESKKTAADLQQLNLELRRLTTRLIHSQEVERQRIARELHDDINQRLAVLMMDIDLLQGEVPFEKESQHAALTRLMTQLDELSTDVHQLSHRLHSSKLQHLGLSAAFQELCTQLSSRHAIRINLHTTDIPAALPEALSLCFYRVGQEGLKNAIKHSQSQQINVSISRDQQVLRLHIQDFGIGFDQPAHHSGLGLVTMEERLRMVGGTLSVKSVPSCGTEIIAEAEVPSHQAAAA